jgi:hypothetical protein
MAEKYLGVTFMYELMQSVRNKFTCTSTVLRARRQESWGSIPLGARSSCVPHNVQIGADDTYRTDNSKREKCWAPHSHPVHSYASHRPALGPTELPVKWVPGTGGRSVALTNRPHPQRRGKEKNRAITLLPLWTFIACSRVNFTFNFLTLIISHILS